MAHWSELSLCDPVTGVGADKQWIWDSLVVDQMKGHLVVVVVVSNTYKAPLVL